MLASFLFIWGVNSLIFVGNPITKPCSSGVAGPVPFSPGLPASSEYSCSRLVEGRASDPRQTIVILPCVEISEKKRLSPQEVAK